MHAFVSFVPGTSLHGMLVSGSTSHDHISLLSVEFDCLKHRFSTHIYIYITVICETFIFCFMYILSYYDAFRPYTAIGRYVRNVEFVEALRPLYKLHCKMYCTSSYISLPCELPTETVLNICERKSEFALCLINYFAVKTCEGARSSTSNLILDGAGWSTSRPCHFTSGKAAPVPIV
jgi:hypothetical protein